MDGWMGLLDNLKGTKILKYLVKSVENYSRLPLVGLIDWKHFFIWMHLR